MNKVTYLFFVVMMLSGCDELAEKQMDDIYGQVSSDAVEQYNIAKRQGDPMQACVQAGMVAAAFLQAKDESNYNVWKATEATDCSLAGLP